MNIDSNKKRSYVFEITLAIIYFLINIASMLFYAGGTKENMKNVRYSILGNYFSDLGMTVSYSGKENTFSMILFILGLICISISIVLFSLRILREYNKKINKVLLGLSFFITVFAVLMGFSPQNLVPILHTTFAYCFSVFFISYLIVFHIIISSIKEYKNIYKVINLIFELLLVIFTLLVVVFAGNMDYIVIVGQKTIIYLGIVVILIQYFGFMKYSESTKTKR